MEEVGHERDSLKRQLENAIVDSRKTVESEIEKASARVSLVETGTVSDLQVY